MENMIDSNSKTNYLILGVVFAFIFGTSWYLLDARAEGRTAQRTSAIENRYYKILEKHSNEFENISKINLLSTKEIDSLEKLKAKSLGIEMLHKEYFVLKTDGSVLYNYSNKVPNTEFIMKLIYSIPSEKYYNTIYDLSEENKLSSIAKILNKETNEYLFIVGINKDENIKDEFTSDSEITMITEKEFNNKRDSLKLPSIENFTGNYSISNKVKGYIIRVVYVKPLNKCLFIKVRNYGLIESKRL